MTSRDQSMLRSIWDPKHRQRWVGLSNRISAQVASPVLEGGQPKVGDRLSNQWQVSLKLDINGDGSNMSKPARPEKPCSERTNDTAGRSTVIRSPSFYPVVCFSSSQKKRPCPHRKKGSKERVKKT